MAQDLAEARIAVDGRSATKGLVDLPVLEMEVHTVGAVVHGHRKPLFVAGHNAHRELVLLSLDDLRVR